MPYTPRERGQEFRVLGIVKDKKIHALKYDECVHMSVDRIERKERIMSLGAPKHMCSFIVDTNHIEGAQIHSLYNTGVVVIASVRMQKIITMFIATPAQIHRYTHNLPNLERLAQIHMQQGLTQ